MGIRALRAVTSVTVASRYPVRLLERSSLLHVYPDSHEGALFCPRRTPFVSKSTVAPSEFALRSVFLAFRFRFSVFAFRSLRALYRFRFSLFASCVSCLASCFLRFVFRHPVWTCYFSPYASHLCLFAVYLWSRTCAHLLPRYSHCGQVRAAPYHGMPSCAPGRRHVGPDHFFLTALGS